jgi:hypothetical protein
MRRWFSLFDAFAGRDRCWHSMLLAIVLEYLLAGIDPFNILRHPTKQNVSDDAFVFKESLLRTLSDPMHQNISRSLSIVFKATKAHHAQFVQASNDKGCSPAYHSFLASSDAWLRKVIIPTMVSSFTDPSALQYIGFEKSALSFRASSFDLPTGIDEDQAHIQHFA